MYSSKGGSFGFGAAKLSFKPAVKYSGVVWIAQPLGQPAGQAGKRSHLFAPVSKAFTGARSALGAPSFKYFARKGARISLRKYRPVALENFRAPSELASSISWP